MEVSDGAGCVVDAVVGGFGAKFSPPYEGCSFGSLCLGLVVWRLFPSTTAGLLCDWGGLLRENPPAASDPPVIIVGAVFSELLGAIPLKGREPLP